MCTWFWSNRIKLEVDVYMLGTIWLQWVQIHYAQGNVPMIQKISGCLRKRKAKHNHMCISCENLKR